MENAWKIDEAHGERYPKLNDDLHVDVCIIGAGLTGLNAAYEFHQKFSSVVVVDALTLGGGESGQKIQGEDSVLSGFFQPERKAWRGIKNYVTENLNVAKQYAERLVLSDENRIACHLDDSGRLTRLSANCPHLGCVVHWNPFEKTWDCPCHGSRFTAEGKVLHGPATTDLKKLNGR